MTSEKLGKLIEKYHHNVTIVGLGDENLSDEQVVAAIEKHATQCGVLYEVHKNQNSGEPTKNEGTVAAAPAVSEPAPTSNPEPAKEEKYEEVAAAPVASPEGAPVSAEPAAEVSEPAPVAPSPEPKESKEEEAPVEASAERSNNPKGPKGKK